MSERHGVGGPQLPADQHRVQLVVDLVRHLSAWERALSQPQGPDRRSLVDLHQQSTELQNRARAVGHGGVALHLSLCTRFLEAAGPINVTGLRASLSDLSELAWQAKQELSAADKALVDRSLAKSSNPPTPQGADAGIAPPPMMTIFPNLSKGKPQGVSQDIARGLPPASVAPPPLVPADWSGRPDAASPARDPSQPAPVVLPPPSLPSPEPVVAIPAPRPAAPAPHQAQPLPAQREPPAPAQEQPPSLAVRTMFGLRAFRKGGGEPDKAAPPAQPGDQVLGLRGFSNQALPSAPVAPPMLSASLPPLPGRSDHPRPERPPNTIQNLLSRMGGDTSRGANQPPRSPRTDGSKRKRTGRNLRRGSSGSSWWIGAAAALGVAVLAVVLVIGWYRLRQPTSGNRLSSPSASGALAPPPVAQASSGSNAPSVAQPGASDDSLRNLLDRARGQGGKESPELKAFVEHQASIQEKLLVTGKCDGSAAACSALFRSRGDAEGRGNVIAKKKPPTGQTGLRPRWLAGLKMPDRFPVEDDPRVQRVFEKYTDTQVGRALFESMLFRCGSYRDRIQESLIRNELPQSLLAVVFAESGCDPLAKSPVGAEGLWQFMPEAGRAYHLHIIEDVIDERHSPPKSTEAAIRFLSDLYKKFGSWDLVFAAYNMGPYGLMGRMNRAGGGDVGFWDLLDADLLPSETAQYVPIIEAFALILENLQRLKFAGTQMRAPEVTADLNAAGGTRLSLVARAASTSVNQLRLLNLDVKGETVPNIPGQLFPIQVPKDVVWQARDTLQDLSTHAAYEDQCVPPTFDWGKQRFTRDMEEDCRARFGGAAPARVAGPASSR